MAKNGTHPAPKRTYSNFERVAVMTVALKVGVIKAAAATRTPESTIYDWFTNAGGIAEIRRFADMAKDQTLSTFEKAVYDEATRRVGLDELTDGAIFGLAETLIKTKSVVDAAAAGSSASAAAGASANAQVIQVTVKE